MCVLFKKSSKMATNWRILACDSQNYDSNHELKLSQALIVLVRKLVFFYMLRWMASWKSTTTLMDSDIIQACDFFALII